MMIKLLEIDNERDFRVVRETYVTCHEFNVHCQERREQMIEMQPFLHVSTLLADSYSLLKDLQDYELEKCKDLMKSISETQLKVLKKIFFIAKLRRVKVFDKKGIYPTDYYIRFKLADSVPKQGDLQHKIIHQVQILVLLLPEEGNTFHNFRVLVMLCFIDYLLPRTKTCMDFPHNLQKSPGNVIVPIHLSVHHHSSHHGQIAETRRFINVVREQAHSLRTRLAQLNAMISEIEAMNDPEEFYDALFFLRDDKRVEYNMLMAINDVIAKAKEKLTTKEAHFEIIEAEINPV
ncbi:hypothetical protein Tco_0478503 [Tanacetum coccineum]